MSLSNKNRHARVAAALILSGLPAIALSAVLMSIAGAGTSLIVLQLTVGLIAATLCRIVIWRGWTISEGWQVGFVVVLAVLLCLPLLIGAPDGPKRWIGLAGVRLYAASMALPAMVFVLSAILARSAKYRLIGFAIAVAAALALARQPDASQVTALSVALAVVVVHTPLRVVEKVVLAIVLAACNGYVWSQPDPLQPVAYVEGVIDVAGSAGVGVLALAIVVLVLPVVILVWRARTLQSVGLLAVAAYYVSIGVCAYQQLTPMPLLGFGAGPILGFYLFSALLSLAAPHPVQSNPPSVMRD